MVLFGFNPSFCNWSSRLPLFNDPILRGKLFEVFGEDGLPTGKPSELEADGWPKDDGVTWNGVRLFGGMDGAMPEFREQALNNTEYKLKVSKNAAFVSWKKRPSKEALNYLKSNPMSDLPYDWASMNHLSKFPSAVIRTLDWQLTNKVQDLSLPDPYLQGTDQGMSLQNQITFVKRLNSKLWWCVPPRYETPVEVYKEQLRRRLQQIKESEVGPVVLEYGNELWNADFPIHHVLTPKWWIKAAKEIAILKDVADQTLGVATVFQPKPYYLFVGSHFQSVDSTALIISELDSLGITPDIAGPAFYVGPLKSDIELWNRLEKVPTQAELQHSCFARLQEMKTKLFEHKQVVNSLGVPYFGLYECGQSMIAKGKPWREAAITAQKTEWLGTLVKNIKSTIETNKVDVALWYSACTDQTPENTLVDVFGYSEGLGKDLLPKAKALAS